MQEIVSRRSQGLGEPTLTNYTDPYDIENVDREFLETPSSTRSLGRGINNPSVAPLFSRTPTTQDAEADAELSETSAADRVESGAGNTRAPEPVEPGAGITRAPESVEPGSGITRTPEPVEPGARITPAAAPVINNNGRVMVSFLYEYKIKIQ